MPRVDMNPSTFLPGGSKKTLIVLVIVGLVVLGGAGLGLKLKLDRSNATILTPEGAKSDRLSKKPAATSPTPSASPQTSPSSKPSLNPLPILKPTPKPLPLATLSPTPAATRAPVITPAPTPAPVPAPSAYPDGTNTGWQPTGVALTGSGGITINTAGTVIDSRNFTDLIQINANNVTIKRSKVSFTTQTYLIRVAAGVTGTIIQDVEINGGAGSYTGIIGENLTVRRVNISNVENGLILSLNSSIADSYIHNLFNTGAPHYDGVEINGGTGITINHNTIAIPNETGTVNANNYFGPVANIAITNNKLTGGTYTIYVDGQFSGGSVTGVSIMGNRIGGGQYGYALIRNATVSQSGNVDNATGNAITL